MTPGPIQCVEMSTPPRSNPQSTGAQPAVHAVLVPGFWLGTWAWEAVEPPLQAAGITTHPVTLPGLDGRSAEGVTLDDQIDAVVGLVDDLTGAGGDVVLVGHSAGGTVVQGVVDRRPERIRRVVYVDSGPLVDGVVLFPEATGDIELPSWERLTAQNSSVEGMDGEALARFRRLAVAEPVGVATAEIRLTDEGRHLVPASVVCTSFDSGTLGRMIDSGDIPSELGSVQDVRFVDLPTGHWPMFSRPADLAEVLRDEILS